MIQFIVNDENLITNPFDSQRDGRQSMLKNIPLGLTDKLPLKKYKDTDITIENIIQTDIQYMIWVLDNTKLVFKDEVLKACGANDDFINQTKMY